MSHRMTEYLSKIKGLRSLSIVEVTYPDQVWEFDIKYVWIHRESRNTYLLAMIDCYTREVVGYYLGYHCTGKNMIVVSIRIILSSKIGIVSLYTHHSDFGIY